MNFCQKRPRFKYFLQNWKIYWIFIDHKKISMLLVWLSMPPPVQHFITFETFMCWQGLLSVVKACFPRFYGFQMLLNECHPHSRLS